MLLTMLEKQRQRLANGWLSASELTGYTSDAEVEAARQVLRRLTGAHGPRYRACC